MASITWFFFFLPVLLVLILKQRKKKGDHADKKLPPGPPKLPVVGNLHQLGSLPHRSFAELAKRHGPVMNLQLGRIPVVVVSSSEMAKEVLKTQDLSFCSRPNLVALRKYSYDYHDVAFTPYSEFWRDLRKLYIRELFSPKKLHSFRYVRDEEVAKMMSSITSQIDRSNPVVNISEKMLSIANNVVCRVAFGKSYEGEGEYAERSKLNSILAEAVTLMSAFFAEDYFPGGGWIVDLLSGQQRRLDKNSRELDAFYLQVINEHLDSGQKMNGRKHEDIIDVLIRLKKEEGQLTMEHLKGSLMNILAAGTDTSAGTLTWAMSELARNPTTMKKAQDEVREMVVGKNNIVEEDDLPKLPYLKMVVRETLRLHPPGPLMAPHQTMKNCTVAGYHIPEKTRVYVNVWAIGRDANSWERPDEFIPERFMDNEVDYRGHDFQLLPFGSGRRICPGMQFGLINVVLPLANLLYAFNWELPAGIKNIDVDEAPGIVVHKKNALCLSASKYIDT